MSEQQQRKVRFYRQVDIVPISPRPQYRTSSAQPKQMDSSSSQGGTVSKSCPSMEALSLYGDESPSPPTEMSTMVQTPFPSATLSLFERMKCAEVPKPPSPVHEGVPSSQQDMEMDLTESLGDTMVQSPPQSPKLSLFERMKRAEVPAPPSPVKERLPSPEEDPAMELTECSGNTAVRSPSPSLQLSFFERMKRAKVPLPPSPFQERLPSPEKDLELELAESSGSTVVRSPSPSLRHSFFERMKRAKVPSPPSPVQEWLPSPATASKLDLFERMRHAQVPPPPTPPPASEMDPFQTLESVAVPSPSSHFEELHIEQGDEPDRGCRIDFGDPDRGCLRALFNTGLTGICCYKLHFMPIADDDHVGDIPTDDECRDLQRAGLASTDTEDDVLHALQEFKSWHLNHPPPVHYPYDKNLDVHIVQAMKRMGADIQQLKELEHLVLVTVSRESFPPLLPACFHAYLCCQEDKARFQQEISNIPLGAFRMIDSLHHYIPDWTPRTPNKYVGFVFPWWLHGSSQYLADFQQLRGGRIFHIADEYFQYAWPARNSSMGDQIDGWIEAQVNTYMKSLREIAEEIAATERNVNHLFVWWVALSRLLGVQDIA
ncbi:hypothetical protein PISMIDRAFT_17710 [Pisolithus microcarpus 441]|uniref:Uncharacterized protein n=1 Tax=Pisolithus microcarpus 441 TaxID=765257 RepID=A0A0C9YU88_9AGAM|nr:hypothetical protein PISMIDRAFT_17710 [Pisolithus microcarpus 441]